MLGMLTLGGYVDPGLHLLVAPMLFLAGTALGFGHGLGLALAGRPRGFSLGRALKESFVAVLLSLPLVAAAWVLTAGITLASTLRSTFYPSRLAVSGVAWLAGTGLCVWAAFEGIRMLRTAHRRCRHRVIGSLAVALLFVGALSLLLRLRPGLRFGSTDGYLIGATLVAGALAVWFFVPTVYVILGVAFRGEGADAGGEPVGR